MALKRDNRFKVVGHRGARGLAPENTLAAIFKALEYDVDEVEIDIRTTSDGIVVLCHNQRLNDPSGNKLKVNASTYATLKEHKPDLIVLSEAAAAVKGKTSLLIDVKQGTNTEQLIKEINQLLKTGWSPRALTVASFNYSLLKQIHQALPTINYAVNEQWSGVRAHQRAEKLSTKRLNMQRRWLWRGYVGPLARRGYQIYGYTLNDPKRARLMAGYGLYGAITDYPDRFA